ncbi:MAG: histidinol-phosphatase [Alphaproteobacteria bacterium]|nr:histidinol-phosphatase [Alphaproteobacteria bacterium]
MTEPCPDAYVALAEQLADASGEIIRRYFRTPVDIETKADESPVTVADREAEAAMRAIIEDVCPDHGIFGEEFDFVRTDAAYAWVLDPIDGTKAFITGLPVFGTLVALMRNGLPILGVIDQPIMGERWIGAAGRQTTLNGAPVAARQGSTLETASLYATHPDMFSRGNDMAKMDALAAQVDLMRFGGDCYSYGLLASGHVDLVVEACLAIYDFMALVPVVTGAGGVMTDWNGQPLSRDSDGHVLAAANAACHAGALALLRDA